MIIGKSNPGFSNELEISCNKDELSPYLVISHGIPVMLHENKGIS